MLTFLYKLFLLFPYSNVETISNVKISVGVDSVQADEDARRASGLRFFTLQQFGAPCWRFRIRVPFHSDL